MDTQELDEDAFELPTINPWRQRPSREQIRFALDLCHSEKHPTVGLSSMSATEVSQLIDVLKAARARRLRKAPRSARWRLAPLGGRR